MLWPTFSRSTMHGSSPASYATTPWVACISGRSIATHPARRMFRVYRRSAAVSPACRDSHSPTLSAAACDDSRGKRSSGSITSKETTMRALAVSLLMLFIADARATRRAGRARSGGVDSRLWSGMRKARLQGRFRSVARLRAAARDEGQARAPRFHDDELRRQPRGFPLQHVLSLAHRCSWLTRNAFTCFANSGEISPRMPRT